MKIIVDAMGGDNGPRAAVGGSIEAANEYGVNIVLVGKYKIIEKELKKNNYDSDRIEIVNADDIITNEDEPAMAIRRKKNSSMVIGFKMLKEDQGDAFISAGNTGAILSGGILIVKRIKGIERAAIASVYPTKKGLSLLIDAGANVDCKPKYLQQFGIMGSVYCEKVLDIKNPQIGLVNIGAEKEKGNIVSKETYKLLSDSNINFIGNIEARDIPKGVADVILCDGFVGNIILKLTEGLAISFFSILKDEISKSTLAKLGVLMCKSSLKKFKPKLDYRQYGGAPLLGLRKTVIKAHGSSDKLAIKNAIKQAKICVDNKVVYKINKNINIIK